MDSSSPMTARPDDEVMTIGQFARATGLSISTLRFYDSAGVLAPAEVDPGSGYRLYRAGQLDAGRLASRLRRIGLGTREIQRVVEGDPAVVDALLGEHLRRLEAGLEDARAELARLREQLADGRHPEGAPGIEQRFEILGSDLARAVAMTRFAVAVDDPEVAAFFLDLADDELSVVTTDRFRMAASTVPAPMQAGSRTGQLALSVAAAEALAAAVADSGALTVTVLAGTLSVSNDSGLTIMVPTSAESIPDHRRIMATTAPVVPLAGEASELLEVLRGAPSTVYLGGDDGQLVLAVERSDRAVPVSRDYLRSAVGIAGAGPVTVTLCGAKPLAVTFDDRPETSVVIMPMRA